MLTVYATREHRATENVKIPSVLSLLDRVFGRHSLPQADWHGSAIVRIHVAGDVNGDALRRLTAVPRCERRSLSVTAIECSQFVGGG